MTNSRARQQDPFSRWPFPIRPTGGPAGYVPGDGCSRPGSPEQTTFTRSPRRCCNRAIRSTARRCVIARRGGCSRNRRSACRRRIERSDVVRSISTTHLLMWWMPTTKPGANSSKAIPPSTSNLHRRFARTQQSMEVQVMAAVPDANFQVRHKAGQGAYKIHPSSGYSPALSAGDSALFRARPPRPWTRRRGRDRSRSPPRLVACGRERRSSLKRISSSAASSCRRSRP